MCFDWIDFSLHTTVHTLQKPSTGNLHLICTKEMGVWGVINKLKSCKGLIVLIPHILNNFFKDKQNYLISLQIENKMKKWMNQWLNCWGRQPIISLHCSECRRFFFFPFSNEDYFEIQGPYLINIFRFLFLTKTHHFFINLFSSPLQMLQSSMWVLVSCNYVMLAHTLWEREKSSNSTYKQKPRGFNVLLCPFIWSCVGVISTEFLMDLRKPLRTGKLFMKSSRVQKVIYRWVNQNCWPLTHTTVEQWFLKRDSYQRGYLCIC